MLDVIQWLYAEDHFENCVIGAVVSIIVVGFAIRTIRAAFGPHVWLDEEDDEW